MTNAVCTAYTVVTAETATFDSGWYVVTNEVSRDTIKVENGEVKLTVEVEKSTDLQTWEPAETVEITVPWLKDGWRRP